MRLQSSIAPVFAGLLFMLPGCGEPAVTAISAHNAGKGTGAVYAASFDDAWKAAHVVLKWDQAGTPEDHLDQRFVITNHPNSDAPSSLDQVGIWFEPMNPDKTRVVVVVMAGNASVPGFLGHDEQTVQKDFAKALAWVESGQPIPDRKP